MTTEIFTHAQVLFDYHKMDVNVVPCDYIVGLGCTDLKVSDRCVELYNIGIASKILFSGGVGGKSVHEGNSEAEWYMNRALELGVPSDDILIENKSSNTGENIRFCYELIKNEGLRIGRLCLVSVPYMARRIYATFKQQWPDKQTDFIITYPEKSLQEYFAVSDNETERVINILVGFTQRMRVYAESGFQIPQNVPKYVMKSYEYLKDIGYTKFLAS